MNILIVDDSELLRRAIIRYLELKKKFENIFEANTIAEAKELMQKNVFDVILFDIQMRDGSGLELVVFAHQLTYRPFMILCSNYILPQYVKTYKKLSITNYFDKSSELDRLKTFIQGIKGNHRYNVGNIN